MELDHESSPSPGLVTDAAAIPPFGGWQRAGRLPNEGRLMLAVLDDAVACYRRHARFSEARTRSEFVEVRDWFQSTDRATLFSFENICEVLDLDPDYVRQRLREV